MDFSATQNLFCALEGECLQEIRRTLLVFLRFELLLFFTAPCLLHKAPDLLLNPRPPKGPERSDEEREVPDPGDDV